MLVGDMGFVVKVVLGQGLVENMLKNNGFWFI